MNIQEFQQSILEGIPAQLPEAQKYDPTVSHAPRRKDILTKEEKKLALRNALRYFKPEWHAVLAPEFMEELRKYGRIYMYRFRPTYRMYARPIDEYPAKSKQAAAIMLMIQNNLDYAIAQHPHELITYGGNGAVFQNWAQYLLAMQYLAKMTDEQTLVLYSGHPMGLFPSHKNAPRVVVTNGMVIPNYSKPDDWERMNALCITVRTNDSRVLHVYRTSGDCSWNNNHSFKCCQNVGWRYRREIVYHFRLRWHVRSTTQSG